MSLLDMLGDVVLFHTLVFGLGILWWPRWTTDAVERLTWVAAIGLLQLYAGVWVIYLTGAPAVACLGLPLLAVAGLLVRRQAIRDLLLDPDGRRSLGRLWLFSGWCLGWLALIRSYSGGEWSGDWLEHYQRARFFTDHAPLTTQFLGAYGLTARPPLANLVVAAGLYLRGPGFVHAQVFLALFSALALLPALALGRLISRRPGAEALLLVAMMFSPFVVQNATFAWTKLPSAFFVLTAMALYWRGVREGNSIRIAAAAAALAGGVLTHYSAAPYAIAFAILHGWHAWHLPSRRAALLGYAGVALVFSAVLAPWLGWAAAKFGAAATFLGNTTATADAGLAIGTRIGYRLHSLWVTLVPHPLRPADYEFIAQTSREGWIRDYWFNIYQTTLFGLVGFAGWARWLTTRALPPDPHPAFGRQWIWFIAMVSLLSFAAVSHADRWGVAHLELQPLVLAGFVYLAFARVPRWPGQPWLWWTGLAVDASLGIALHFHVMATVRLTPEDLSRFLHGQVSVLSHVAAQNALAKQLFNLTFVADGGPNPVFVGVVLGLLATIALIPIWRASKTPSPPSDDAR